MLLLLPHLLPADRGPHGGGGLHHLQEGQPGLRGGDTEHIVLVCCVDIMCQVSEDSKICSACRFNKCLQVGMRVELLQVITTRKRLLKEQNIPKS